MYAYIGVRLGNWSHAAFRLERLPMNTALGSATSCIAPAHRSSSFPSLPSSTFDASGSLGVAFGQTRQFRAGASLPPAPVNSISVPFGGALGWRRQLGLEDKAA